MSIYDQTVRPSTDATTATQGAFVASTATVAAARKRQRSAFSESRDQHFAPALMRSAIVIVFCVVLMMGADGVLWYAEPAQTSVRVSIIGAMLVMAISFFLWGNTYRLRDIRRRMGNRARAGLIAPIDALSELPPRDTIHGRFVLGAAGAGFGLIALVLLSVFGTGNQTNAEFIGPGIGLISAIICFLAGSYSRPVD